MDDLTLSSDHLNYLIWRYLQEQGHGQAAAKLQHAWLPGGDPQSLGFANRINKRALVTLVHKGLQYHQIERVRSAEAAIAAATPPVALYFGSQPGRTASSAFRRASRQRHGRPSAQTQTPSPSHTSHAGLPIKSKTTAPEQKSRSQAGPKRARRSNGSTEEVDPDAMQLDHADRLQRGQAGDAKPSSPMATVNQSTPFHDPLLQRMDVDESLHQHQQAQIVPVVTNGPSVGVQSDRIIDLAPHSTVLTVAEKENIIHTRWHAADPSVLAIAGDACCRLWRLPPSSQDNAPTNESTTSPSYLDILGSIPNQGLVTALSWTQDGQYLAIATRGDVPTTIGTVSTWTADGKAVDELTAGADMIIKLGWNSSGNLLMGITSSGDGESSLIVWDVLTALTLPPIACDKVVTDAAWLGDSNAILLCAQGAIGTCEVTSNEPVIAWLADPMGQISSSSWSHLVHDASARASVVVDDEAARLAFVDEHGTLTIKNRAHDDCITSIADRKTSSNPQSTSVLATCALDGLIRLWNIRTASLLSTFHFSSDSPPLALAFSPNGDSIAAATFNRLLIWNTPPPPPSASSSASSSSISEDNPNSFLQKISSPLPLAKWQGDFEFKEMQGKTLASTGHVNNINGNSVDRDSGIGDDDDDEEDRMAEPCCTLDWDCKGGRLAFGMGNQIAIIDVQLHDHGLGQK